MAISLTSRVSGGAVSKSQTNTATGDNTNTYEVTVGTNVTDLILDISLDVGNLTGYYIHANNTLQIETNATDATGGDTLSLVANYPLVWNSTDGYYTNLLANDVTKMYLTNASGTETVTLIMVFEQDSTTGP